ncbi:MAG: sortase [Candidatus Andersenbacteria bacterium]
MLRRIPTSVLRGFLVLELGGVAFVATAALLNGPAYLQQVRYNLSGGDLSHDIAGTYVPIEQIPAAPAGQDFPYAEVSLGTAVPAPASSSSSTSPAPPLVPPVPTINSEEFVPNTVTVPRIGARAPIVELKSNTDKAQQAGLAHGAIHAYGTPAPGQPGTALIAAHSSDFIFKLGAYKTVFALLPELHSGDYFIVSDDHTMRYFRITQTVVVAPTDTSFTVHKDHAAYVALQTSYPVGTALKRFVAVGVLERTVLTRP